jgi:hypothetical protein
MAFLAEIGIEALVVITGLSQSTSLIACCVQELMASESTVTIHPKIAGLILLMQC